MPVLKHWGEGKYVCILYHQVCVINKEIKKNQVCESLNYLPDHLKQCETLFMQIKSHFR